MPSPRSHWLPLALALVLGSPALLGCQGKGSDDEPPPASPGFGTVVGHPAPPLAGKSIHGEPLDLATLRGEVVLVNVWATWCKPCNLELPELARLHDSLADRGFKVFGVSTDHRQLLPQVLLTVQRHRLRYPMLFDPEGQATAPWGIHGYPTSILINRNGTVRWRRDGIIEPDDPELRGQIDAALAEPRP